MLFKKTRTKDRDMEEDYEFGDRDHMTILETLISLCEDGTIYEDAFVLEDEDIYVYADLISMQNNVAQIMFQIHHEWLEEPIFEAVAAAGNTKEEAIANAVKQFFEQVLLVYLQAVRNPMQDEKIEAFTQERHYFYVYRGAVSGIGKRMGVPTKDFWGLLKSDIIAHLGNKKVYWIKIFASKKDDELLCEVRINGKEAPEISKRLLHYAGNWEGIHEIHTEKQCMMFVQDASSYEKSDFTKVEIEQLCDKAIRQYEKCKTKEDHKKLRAQLVAWCKDDSLAYEIFSFIPELYCKYAYPQVEFGGKLFLVEKNKETRELFQSQLQSFSYVDKRVEHHFKNENPSTHLIQQVLSFSANAKAIHKALEQGDAIDELMVPGFAYLGCSGYQWR